MVSGETGSSECHVTSACRWISWLTKKKLRLTRWFLAATTGYEGPGLEMRKLLQRGSRLGSTERTF